MDIVKKYYIRKYDKESISKTEDTVIIEYLFTIFLDGEEYITLVCTPKSLEELAIGFLHSESIIKTTRDIKKIDIYADKGYVDIELENRELLNKKSNLKRTITSGCGKGSMYYNEIDELRLNDYSTKKYIAYENVIRIMSEFNKKSELFKETGGVHSVALSDFEDIIYFEEDIGRHNALDKIIGRCIKENIDIKDKVVLTSGRITSEIVLKCAKLNINFIISRSAPTNVAIDLANIVNMTIVGFARGQKMNIYTV